MNTEFEYKDFRENLKVLIYKAVYKPLRESAHMIQKTAKSSIKMRKYSTARKGTVQASAGKTAKQARRLSHIKSGKRYIVKRGVSKAGFPHQTRKGKSRRAIDFQVEKKEMLATIGPRFSKIDLVSHTHEFGGMYEGRKYPKRAVMKPALYKTRQHILPKFQGIL